MYIFYHAELNLTGFLYRLVGLVGRVFTNGPGVQFQVESYQRLKKMQLDTSLLNSAL